MPFTCLSPPPPKTFVGNCRDFGPINIDLHSSFHDSVITVNHSLCRTQFVATRRHSRRMEHRVPQPRRRNQVRDRWTFLRSFLSKHPPVLLLSIVFAMRVSEEELREFTVHRHRNLSGISRIPIKSAGPAYRTSNPVGWTPIN